MKLDPIFITILSDLFTNLSAGWIGAAIIIPLNATIPNIKLGLLIVNIILAIVSLAISFALKKGLAAV